MFSDASVRSRFLTSVGVGVRGFARGALGGTVVAVVLVLAVPTLQSMAARGPTAMLPIVIAGAAVGGALALM